MYVSSIINKYGDTENVKNDVRALRDIMQRQGMSLLIDAMAEYSAENILRFKISNTEAEKLNAGIVNELREALNERI